jgi:ribosome-associated heat shock protein Hsp15
MEITESGARRRTRLDQWLWFARIVKSRSLAARLCAAGAVTVNGCRVKKANHPVRLGDIVVLPQGGWQKTVRVVALGMRRGPAPEARLLYEEAAVSVRLADLTPPWMPLLGGEEFEPAAAPAG